MHWITKSVKPDSLSSNEYYYPLLSIRKLTFDKQKNIDIAIFTSQHGIVDCGFKQAFVVGNKTAIKITNCTNIKIFNNVSSLISFLQNVKGKKICYYKGEDVTDSLDFLAQNNDFMAVKTYCADFVTDLPSDLVSMLKTYKISQVSIFSKRSYDNFIILMNKYLVDYTKLKITIKT